MQCSRDRRTTRPRRHPLRPILALLVGTVCAASPLAAAEPFTVEKLAERVHLFRVPATDVDHTNALVVELKDGLLVVESQPSPAAAGRFLKQLREKLEAPVRYLVLGHAHTESTGGASAFPPTATIVAAQGCARSLEDPAFDPGAEMRLRAADPQAWEEPPRILPELVVHALTELADPLVPVQLIPLPRAHSQGDLSVFLPEQGIAYIGPMIFRRDNPYPGGGSVSAWIAGLNQLVLSDVARFVPLRGEILDKGAIRLDRDSLAWLRGQVSLAFAEGVEPATMPEHLAARPERPQYFSAQSEPSFFLRFARQAVDEALTERRKRGWRE